VNTEESLCVYVILWYKLQGIFVTVRTGTAYRHLFEEKKNVCVMYIFKEFCVPAPFLKCEEIFLFTRISVRDATKNVQLNTNC